jgi:hypothetical protein
MDKLNSIEVTSFSEFKSELIKIINTYTITGFYFGYSLPNYQRIFKPIEIKGEFNGYKFEGIYHEEYSFDFEDYFDEIKINQLLKLINEINEYKIVSIYDFVSECEVEEGFCEIMVICEDLYLIEINWDIDTPNEIINSLDTFKDIEKYIKEKSEGEINNPEFEFIEIGLTCSEIDSEFELIWNER